MADLATRTPSSTVLYETAPPTLLTDRWPVLFTQVWTGLYALTWGLGFFGLPALVLAWVIRDAAEVANRQYTFTHGLIFGLLACLLAVAQIRRPERHVASAQALAAVAVTFAVAGAVYFLGFNRWLLDAFVPIAAMIVTTTILLALHPARERLTAYGRVSVPLAAVVAIAGLPLIGYAVDQLALERTLTAMTAVPSSTGPLGQGVIAFSLLLVAGVAAAGAPGWPVPAWIAGSGLALLGIAGIAGPRDLSSVGALGGLALVTAGLAFVALAEWERRRARAASLPH